eukprot:337500_1
MKPFSIRNTIIEMTFLLAIIQILSRMTNSCQNGSMIYSSGKRYSTNVTECMYPSNEEEIIELINMARETRSSLRATGKSHSKSGVNMMEPKNGKNVFMINMSVNMNNIIELNKNENKMTFEAGLSLYEVLTYLETHNLTLKYFGRSPLETNFVGCMITGTHGMGSKKNPVPTIASNVINLRMITSNGTIIEANNSLNKDIFDAARISFGALGIITQITVQTQPMLYASMYSNSRFNDVNNIQIAQQIIENNITHFVTDYDITYGRYSIFQQFIRSDYKVIINDTNTINIKCWPDNAVNDNTETIQCTDIFYKVVTPYSLLNFDQTSPINSAIEYEMLIDADLWKEALIGVFEWIFEQQNDRTNLWIDSEKFYNQTNDYYDIRINWRFVGMDNIWLSPSYNRSVFQIGMQFLGENSLIINDKWTFGIHKYLKDNFSPVSYHWGKQSLSKYCDLQESYPKLNDFKNLRNELDPNGIFINQFIRDKLGLCD